MRSFIFGLLALLLMPQLGAAQDKTFVLAVPKALEDSGLAQHLTPRFALKHGVRITRVLAEDGTAADASLGDSGRPVFQGLDQVWHYEAGSNPYAAEFGDWLRSDVGKRTVEGFQPDGTALFTTAIKTETKVVELTYDGDAKAGADLSLEKCGRCHVVGDINRMKAIGSTPSFAVLRTLQDWELRFAGFYALKPHPAFTQIQDVTDPFDPSRPSPISPITLTLDDLESIIAFMAEVAPADLGAPIQSQ